MYSIVNTFSIQKIFLCNGKMTFMAFQLIQSKMYKHSKIKTHYDTLEVSSQATQDEIKSSYYKLSMLYHPDKNKTEFAKRKFQNISEAYEVLSNHQARKRYDRSMMVIKHNIQRNVPKNIYKHASIYKSKTHPMNSKHFNFDLWVKEHYGETFARKQAKYMWLSNEEMSRKSGEVQEFSAFFYLIAFLMTYVFILFGTYYKDDVPKAKKVKRKES